jgi:hypothetical protein
LDPVVYIALGSVIVPERIHSLFQKEEKDAAESKDIATLTSPHFGFHVTLN